jgi:hypothetical protein
LRRAARLAKGMGHQMTPRATASLRVIAALGLGLVSVPCLGQSGDNESNERAPSAATLDVFASTDADDTEVVRTGANFDLSHHGDDRYRGIRLEKAWFTPLGGETTGFERVYLRYADKSKSASWSAQIGTDGDTLLGSANFAIGQKWRKEVFVERDILETPRGVTEGIYYTFVGAALDMPLSRRDTLVLVTGVQEFTGKNERLHLRGTYVHVVKEDWGLTAQLRGRYIRSTEPGEFDYFSPRSYAEVLPVLQMRRFSNGWRFLVAGGYGAQRTTGQGWRSARYANVQANSPANRPLQVKASLLYSNTPVGNGAVYDYLQGTLALTALF